SRWTSDAGLWTWRSSRSRGLQLPQEGDEVRLLGPGEFRPEHQVEELDGVFQGQAAAVVEVGGAVLDPPQGEGLDRAVAGLLEEPLEVQVVHLMVEVEGRGVAGRALPL